LRRTGCEEYVVAATRRDSELMAQSSRNAGTPWRRTSVARVRVCRAAHNAYDDCTHATVSKARSTVAGEERVPLQ